MPFKSILLPVDGSEHATKAAKLALELARACGSMVHLMHCFETIPGTIGGSAREEIARKEAVEACEVLWPYKALFDAAFIPCERHVRYGTASQEIIGAAREYPCNIIVMGHRGLGRAEGFLLGSVGQKVLETSPVPVLVAK